MPDSENKQSTHKHLFDLLFLVDRKMKDIIREEDSGLSMLQIAVMRILVIEGEMSLIEIAQKIDKDKSQITRVVQELEKMGILRKERSQQDRRSFILKMDSCSKKKVSFYMSKEQKLVNDMLEGISNSDQKTLDRLLLQMHKNLKS